MSLLDTVNSILTADWILWSATAISFVLLILIRPVSGILAGGGRDSVTKALRAVIVLMIVLIVALPFLILAAGEPVAGLPYGCFLLIFPLFCYYFGRGVGHEKGRKGIMDLVGLDEYDGMEDAQDRLYESRLRFPKREGVSASIAQLTRGAGDTAPGDSPGPSGTDNHGSKPPRNSEVLDVTVEEV